ncbi:MAG: hypothetical protein GX159_01340 [Flavobacteriaceae bacterium]|jgi:hypothetical protein|nr:hypothetical protein [Flavobacteriaceae bacterium]
MKKLTFILLAVAGSLAFVNCSSDDDKGGKDCFDCNMIVTAKYCYEDGNDYYTVEVMGQSENIPLEGESWANIKAGLQEICD